MEQSSDDSSLSSNWEVPLSNTSVVIDDACPFNRLELSNILLIKLQAESLWLQVKKVCAIKRYTATETDGGGGWTVFRRHRGNAENFNRSWKEYKCGFGHLHVTTVSMFHGKRQLFIYAIGQYQIVNIPVS